MPIYQLDIEKHALAGASTGEYWTNRYLLQAADLDAADIQANYLSLLEIALHTPVVGFSKRSVRDLDQGTDIYRTTPLNTIGTYGGEVPPSILPGMLVVRVDLAVAQGRPSRKFYHLFTGAPTQEDGFWTTSLLTDVNATIANIFDSENGVTLVDPQGQAITSGAALSRVTVHQFRRGSKRKLVPVLP